MAVNAYVAVSPRREYRRLSSGTGVASDAHSFTRECAVVDDKGLTTIGDHEPGLPRWDGGSFSESIYGEPPRT